ncbi:hypothetical protein PHMEG_00028261 [Phytophthora megakarya]|uniref:Uncharacterized protein n=1 Tax=Phytophthora megakarya TaxID=4795 RepID=A0A225V5B9_9STRA|nr:hypothetical protein PHMEG_00028261 [Phytophthora megakarya]
MVLVHQWSDDRRDTLDGSSVTLLAVSASGNEMFVTSLLHYGAAPHILLSNHFFGEATREYMLEHLNSNAHGAYATGMDLGETNYSQVRLYGGVGHDEDHQYQANNALDYLRNVALHYTADYTERKAARGLLKMGVEVNLQHRKLMLTLDTAPSKTRPDFDHKDVLLVNRADINRFGYTLVHQSAHTAHIPLVWGKLLEHCTVLKVKERGGQTPMEPILNTVFRVDVAKVWRHAR